MRGNLGGIMGMSMAMGGTLVEEKRLYLGTMKLPEATVNSDDPAYFGGYMNENYLAVAGALDLSRDDVAQLARNSIDAAFVGDSRKAELRRELTHYLESVA